LIRNCYFILVYGFHKGFLNTFVPLHFMQSSATRGTGLPQLQYAPNSPVTCRPQFRRHLFFSKPTTSVDPKWCYNYWSWTKTDMTFILAKGRGLTLDQNWYAPTEQYNHKNQGADLLYKLQHFSAWGHHHELRVIVHKYVRIFIKLLCIINVRVMWLAVGYIVILIW
jgi:hypothetical protein